MRVNWESSPFTFTSTHGKSKCISHNLQFIWVPKWSYKFRYWWIICRSLFGIRYADDQSSTLNKVCDVRFADDLPNPNIYATVLSKLKFYFWKIFMIVYFQPKDRIVSAKWLYTLKFLWSYTFEDRILPAGRSYTFRQMIVYFQIFMIVYFRRSYTFSRKIVYFPLKDRIHLNWDFHS